MHNDVVFWRLHLSVKLRNCRGSCFLKLTHLSFKRLGLRCLDAIFASGWVDSLLSRRTGESVMVMTSDAHFSAWWRCDIWRWRHAVAGSASTSRDRSTALLTRATAGTRKRTSVIIFAPPQSISLKSLIAVTNSTNYFILPTIYSMLVFLRLQTVTFLRPVESGKP